ncbi:receptor-type tyrosine-protein phosphatase epsilon-like, partial [Ruditapes philippinarum]|uniref:receptor-type tyrosine-protein phosphatase epsilon-like n=1 Tax=Ruditapes philippinarum TaxID=129788 RepID=UPI00295BC418
CDNRTFGVNCSSTCHCLNNTNCNSTTGVCDNGLCDSGWQGPACDQVCNNGTFGYNCSSSCHCLNESHCNSTTGECQIGVCESGWQGPACDQACDNRTFGYNCSSTCHCYNGTSCNSSTGDCDAGSCDSGWQGLSCSAVCDRRRFGDACSSSCHCLNDSNCNSATGECEIGSCDPGWQGYSCDKVCSNRRFGFNCSNTCHCYDNATCNETTGVCTGPGSCDPGWEGSSCSKSSAESTDNSSGSTGAAVGGAVGATVLVVLGVVIGLILFRRIRSSKKNNGQETNFSHLDEALSNRTKAQRRTNQGAHVNRLYEDEQETSMAGTSASDYYSFNEHLTGIKIHELWDYIRNKMENKCEQLISEFKTLQQGLVHPCRSADHISNRGKNRYKDMYAYDHTRVILDDDCEPGDDIHGGYINACYIDGYEKVKKFVASQGPTKNMVDDFWRMVWQLKSDKIVMLTNLIEMGTTKCLQYWPKEEDGETECTFGDIVIRLLEIEKFLDYNIRVFEVTKNGEESRRIRQFHFKSWPDKDVPDSTWCLVNFWRVVDTNIASNAGPIVVHCSAGVGRTGTFIGLDNLVNQARLEGCIRPLQVVQNLRSQRVNMVQTKEQYIYLHEAAADAMYFGTHIIWTKQFRDVLEFMIQKDKVDARTRLQIQFELIEKSVVNSSSEVAESPEYSNVDTLLSESAAYRPKFMNKGSTFVQRLGAMCITNYKGKSTFLVSMSPDKDTMEEFWSLVDDNNIKTVIMLTEQSSSCYQSSCELGSGSGNRFSVNKIEEKRRKGYTQRTFTFKESVREEEDHLTTLKQFEYTAWKDGYPSPGDTTSFLDMIEAVLKWQPHLSESQPVLVHCGDGCTRSGIVCVLLNELQRMKYEGGHVNIVESVKMMKKRQRHLITNYEQYKFCFDLIMDHIKRTEDYQNL